MAIVKIGHRGALNQTHRRQSSHATTTNRIAPDESHKHADDGLDDSDLSDPGCELAIVGDQICTVPYDLYDLSHLRDVLSLETWNSCLTEEERFNLSACLPSMDEETFELTIRELLNGDNLLFGNPLEKFFCRLKGGFYSLQVAPVREGLQFLYKQGYYHSLRLYHESLNQKFEDMRRAWSSCLPSTSVEERVRIWKKRKDQKPVLLVDLNAIPTDEETLTLKKTKYADEEEIKMNTRAIDLNCVAMNTKPKGKGVLKVRSIEMNSTSRSLICESWEPGKRVPKGVLKIKPKFDGFGQRAASLVPPLSSSSSSYLHQTNIHGRTNERLEDHDPWNERQREEFASIPLGPFSNSQNFSRKIKTGSSDRTRSAAGNVRDLFHHTVPSDIGRIPTARIFSQNLNHLDEIGGGLSTTSTSKVISEVERDVALPITYKRKKSFTKLNPVVADLRTDSKLIEKAKTVRIKVKGWSDEKYQYKERRLNGLQRGSPSA